MTEKEKAIIKDYINGEKKLYTELESIYNKYKDKVNIKQCPYMDYLTMYMADKTPNLNNWMKAKKAIKND